MADNNIIFIGMPAVGKSTVGVVIAKRLGYRFVDTDILIQESEGKLLKDIIADVGPDGFLKVEDRVNAQVKAERTVISHRKIPFFLTIGRKEIKIRLLLKRRG